MNTKLLSFANQDEIKTGGDVMSRETQDTYVGGVSIQKYLQYYDKPSNVQQYKRFRNYIVPVGLPLTNKTGDNEIDVDQTEDNHSVVNDARFDTLLFSVGKDLGSSRNSRIQLKEASVTTWFPFMQNYVKTDKNKTQKRLLS